MTDDELTTLWLGATRYYMGRMSYAVSDFCDLLRNQWPSLPERARNLIMRDVKQEIAADDDDRASGREYFRLGHDCDRKQWDKVASLSARIEQ